jgi:hypothetical protein
MNDLATADGSGRMAGSKSANHMSLKIETKTFPFSVFNNAVVGTRHPFNKTSITPKKNHPSPKRRTPHDEKILDSIPQKFNVLLQSTAKEMPMSVAKSTAKGKYPPSAIFCNTKEGKWRNKQTGSRPFSAPSSGLRRGGDLIQEQKNGFSKAPHAGYDKGVEIRKMPSPTSIEGTFNSKSIKAKGESMHMGRGNFCMYEWERHSDRMEWANFKSLALKVATIFVVVAANIHMFKFKSACSLDTFRNKYSGK